MDSNFFNPYQGLTFFGFVVEWFYRMALFFTGQLPYHQLVSDEIQIFVLAGIAASSAFVGTFLILRRMTMLANSFSHTILLGIVIAYYFYLTYSHPEDGHSTSLAPMQILILASLVMGFVTAFLTEFLTKTGRLQEDASTGLVFTSLFALGIILVTVLTRSSHIGAEAVMGNADALHLDDVKWVYLIFLMNILLLLLFYKGYQITTFDAGLADALGFSPILFNYLLMAQVSITAIGAFRAVGVLLVLAFITGPPLTARLLSHRLNIILFLAVGIGALASFVGVAFTRHILTVYGIALSTSGVVVCIIAAFYLLTICYRLLKIKKDIFFSIPSETQAKKEISLE